MGAIFLRSAKFLDAAFGAGDIHQNAAGPPKPLPRRADVGDHPRPGFGVVMRAVDARAIHPGFEQALDQGGVRRRLGRQGRHDSRMRTWPRRAENPFAFAAQSLLAGASLRRRRIGRVGLAAQAPQAGDQRVERGSHLRLAATERGKTVTREAQLQLAQIMAAQGQIIREIERAVFESDRVGFAQGIPRAPIRQQQRRLPRNVVAQRRHPIEQIAQIALGVVGRRPALHQAAVHAD